MSKSKYESDRTFKKLGTLTMSIVTITFLVWIGYDMMVRGTVDRKTLLLVVIFAFCLVWTVMMALEPARKPSQTVRTVQVIRPVTPIDSRQYTDDSRADWPCEISQTFDYFDGKDPITGV